MANETAKTVGAPSRFVIRGGRPLNGEIKVGGMKNAATPIIAATLLIREPVRLENVPRLSDVERMLDILRSLGSTAEWTGPNGLAIDNAKADLASLNVKAVKAMRSSVLLMGPLLSRFHEVSIPEPGGCIIGNRPLDAHLEALGALGAEIEVDRVSGIYTLKAARLVGSGDVLPVFSVTGTENAVMAAVLAEGRTVIRLAAAEPHVEDLCRFLVSAGASIQGLGTHTLVIDGVGSLHGVSHRLIPDQIEAGTFLALGAVTKGTLRITGVEPKHLDMAFYLLHKAGAVFDIEGDTVVMGPHASLRSFKLQTLPYPGFPTDLQSPFGVLATQCIGTSLIQDPMFEGRLSYVNELVKMGANAVICDPHRVLISGPTPLYGQEIRGLDLRAGATLVIAGLIASGETILHGAEIIDRGYERLDERLRAVGADIERAS
jgi:UDP-N-acetylglucosamine 1-carboxyvinyltransferase